MGKFAPSKPKAQGPTEEQLAAQRESERRAKENEDAANKQLSSSARFSTNRRTGRRLLLAPGREDEIAKFGGATGASGGNF